MVEDNSEYLGICRWEDNFKMVLREIRSESVDWMYVAGGRNQCWALVNPVISPQVL